MSDDEYNDLSDLSRYDLQPDDNIEKLISVLNNLYEISEPSMSVTDYVSVEDDSNTVIDEGGFSRELTNIFKPILQATSEASQVIESMVIDDLREKLSKYKKAVEGNIAKLNFPLDSWNIKNYSTYFGDTLLSSLGAYILDIKLPDSFSIQEKLSFYSPVIDKNLRESNDLSTFCLGKWDSGIYAQFLKGINDKLTEKEKVSDYIKEKGGPLDVYYELRGMPYNMKNKVFLNALSKDPFIEGLAHHYIKNNDYKDSELSYLLKSFINYHISNENRLQNFKPFVELSNSLPSFKAEGKKGDEIERERDKALKIYLNALVSYVNELKDVITLSQKDLESIIAKTITTIFNASGLSGYTEDKAKKSTHFEYALMTFDKLSNNTLEAQEKPNQIRTKKF